MLDDPWATPEDVKPSAFEKKRNQIITAGRYRLPDRDGSERKGGWQRVTNLVKAITDQFSLRVWEIQHIMIAMHVAPDAVSRDLALTIAAVQGKDYPTRRGEIEAFLERCKAISGGNEGAKFGNARHELVESHHLETPASVPDAFARAHLYLYSASLKRNDLTALTGMQERRVMIEELGAVGTLDNILRCSRLDVCHVGDLKTQKSFWTWLEIAAQLACYANADAMWESDNDPDNPRAGRWVDMPDVSKEIGLVLWMPRNHPSGEPRVDVYEVDLKAGWETAKLAHRVTRDRSGGKSQNNPRAWLRSAPPITHTERYAARFAAVESASEGRKLVEEAKRAGVWSLELQGEAKRAKERLEKVR